MVITIINENGNHNNKIITGRTRGNSTERLKNDRPKLT